MIIIQYNRYQYTFLLILYDMYSNTYINIYRSGLHACKYMRFYIWPFAMPFVCALYIAYQSYTLYIYIYWIYQQQFERLANIQSPLRFLIRNAIAETMIILVLESEGIVSKSKNNITIQHIHIEIRASL